MRLLPTITSFWRLGGVPNTKLIAGSEHALTFKTLADAIFLRNHIIQLFESADAELNPARKAATALLMPLSSSSVAAW